MEGAADGFFDSSNDILIAEQRENIGFNKDRWALIKTSGL